MEIPKYFNCSKCEIALFTDNEQRRLILTLGFPEAVVCEKCAKDLPEEPEHYCGLR